MSNNEIEEKISNESTEKIDKTDYSGIVVIAVILGIILLLLVKNNVPKIIHEFNTYDHDAGIFLIITQIGYFLIYLGIVLTLIIRKKNRFMKKKIEDGDKYDKLL